jgi:uncharacterized protein YprB with RNaseH-like and TPR domain
MSLFGSDKFGAKLSRIAALRPAKVRVPQEFESVDDSIPDPNDLTSLFGATIARNSFGEHLSIRRWFPTPEKCFEAGDANAANALRLLLPRAVNSSTTISTTRSKHSQARVDDSYIEQFAFDPAQWLFLDTETTGLAGGSGTYPFLIGLAWWDGGGIQTEQFFMRDFGEEHAMLLTLKERMAERRVLVTYNGKSFDWPLLETRFRMTRSIETPSPAVHLDFLHPARQLWKSRLESVRLADLEREILCVSLGSKLDWHRDTDIDGSQIPEIYFNFVRRGIAHALLPVLHHNRMDLRGLAAVAARILELLSLSQQPAAKIDHDAADLFGLARLLDRRREPASARHHYKTALAAGLAPALARTARRELARLSKRAGDHADAVEHWESLLDFRGAAQKQPKAARISAKKRDENIAGLAGVQSLTLERILLRGAVGLTGARRLRAGPRIVDGAAENVREMLEACEQLAIHFEHRAKDLDRAVQMTNHALALIERANSNARHASSYAAESFCARAEERFQRRMARLERKLQRSTFSR